MPTPLTASTMLSATNRKVIAECPAVTTFFPEVSPKHPTRTSVHNRKRNNDHIPRPPNAFLVFRSFLWANRSGRGAGADHRDVSCLAGEKWRAFSARDREPFEEVATLAKARHSELYPHYKYAPSGKKAKSVKRKMKRGGTEEARCNKVALLLMQGMQGTALEEEMEKCDISDGSESRDDSPQTFYTALSSPSSLPPPTPIQDTDSSSATTSPLPFIASEREASRASPSTLEFHGYVPTEQIPPLDLNMSTLCKEEENTFVDTFDYLVDPNQCLAANGPPSIPASLSLNSRVNFIVANLLR
ncbi:hypothetical protein OF83DRAFT_445759 [Amylostereum chailletii]|nr:hypothetical protein OF83DRAFT_445759 [Amylostereum chailletii]